MTDSDPVELLFLTEEEVLHIHSRMLELYGGTAGVRDHGLLKSALAQPCATFGGQFLHEDVSAIAAAYVFHLAMNHSFIDGNKRTALAAG